MASMPGHEAGEGAGVEVRTRAGQEAEHAPQLCGCTALFVSQGGRTFC